MPLDLETNKKEEVSDNMIELLAEMNALKDWADEQLEEDEDYEEEEEVDEIINQLAGEFAMKDMFLQFEIHEPNNEVTEVEQQHFNDEHFDLYDGNEIVANDDDEDEEAADDDDDFMEKFQNIRLIIGGFVSDPVQTNHPINLQIYLALHLFSHTAVICVLTKKDFVYLKVFNISKDK